MAEPKANLGETLKAELGANAAVTALIAARIYPNRRPQTAALPLAVYSIISDVPDNTLAGEAESRLSHARLQVDTYAKTYREAHQVAAAIESVLANLSRSDLAGYRLNTRDLYDDETELHRVSSDYLISR